MTDATDASLVPGTCPGRCRPILSNIGFELDKSFLYHFQLSVGQVVKLVRVRPVVPSNCAAMYTLESSSQSEISPLYLGSQRTLHASGAPAKTVQQRVWSPNKRYAVRLAVGFDQGRIKQLLARVAKGRNLRQVERRRESCVNDRCCHVARRGNHIVIRGAAPSQLGYELIARPQVRSNDITMMRVFKRVQERRIGIAFSHQQAQRVLSRPQLALESPSTRAAAT
jgi:hypothetical protein